jgi:hypothetical protein
VVRAQLQTATASSLRARGSVQLCDGERRPHDGLRVEQTISLFSEIYLGGIPLMITKFRLQVFV